MDKKAFNQALGLWFAKNKRHFPWRDSRDPYLIWISEVMSQQTQIGRVAKDFYPRFVEKFSTVKALSKADWEKDLFPVWDGLGFYRRGQNMLRCAQIVVEKHGGAFPKTLEELETLPGVGKYTASAIMSFAYGEKIPAIDTNVSHIIRVLWPQENTLQVAQRLIENYPDPHEWNSAMMDLAAHLKSRHKVEGDLADFFPSEVAEQFIPKRNRSKHEARSKKKVSQSLSPKTSRLTPSVHRIEVGAACIHRDGKYLIQTRPKGKSFEGFWEFPGGKRNRGEDYRACVKREIMEEIGIQVSVRPHFCETIHEFEEKVLVLRFHRCQIQSGSPRALEKQKLQWVAPSDFHKVKFLPTNKECLEKLKKMRF